MPRCKDELNMALFLSLEELNSRYIADKKLESLKEISNHIEIYWAPFHYRSYFRFFKDESVFSVQVYEWPNTSHLACIKCKRKLKRQSHFPTFTCDCKNKFIFNPRSLQDLSAEAIVMWSESFRYPNLKLTTFYNAKLPQTIKFQIFEAELKYFYRQWPTFYICNCKITFDVPILVAMLLCKCGYINELVSAAS